MHLLLSLCCDSQGGKSTLPTGGAASSTASRPTAATNAATSGPDGAVKNIGPGTGTGTGVPDNSAVRELGKDVTGGHDHQHSRLASALTSQLSTKPQCNTAA